MLFLQPLWLNLLDAAVLWRPSLTSSFDAASPSDEDDDDHDEEEEGDEHCRDQHSSWKVN